ncbi:hypothetical protein [Pseudomonas viridiflava]|uniref:hypothetical protein n=1 Tax=Pseudomonas viridiflava TaxID=33069 RepID=UPI000EFD5562|nr:hypothetical protein [Pseudomonas viridiflava]
MGFLLLLPLLVSGFLVCLKHRGIYYRLHRYEGQLLYLQVARYGMNCLFVSLAAIGLISALISHSWSGCIWFTEFCLPSFSTDFLYWLSPKMQAIGLAKDEIRGEAAAFLVLVSIVAMLLPVPWTKWLMRRLKKNLKRRLSRQDKGGAEKFEERADEIVSAYLLKESVAHSPRLKMLYEAFANQQPVMLSMSDRKVYVGNILSLGAHTEVAGIDQELHLAPIISGYRDDDTLELTYTTDYAGLAVECPIYLKQENIVSVTLYFEDVRVKFEGIAKKKSLRKMWSRVLEFIRPAV